MSTSSPLAGAAVIVTGASSGIGAAAAEAFAREGANLTLSGRRAELLEEVAERCRARGVQVLVSPGDVAEPAVAEACVQAARERHGRLDVLAHVAGVNTPRRNLHNMTADEWRRVIDVNLNGVYFFVRAALPHLRAQGSGSIVIVGSDSGLLASELAGAAYCASKFGVTALVGSINAEERRHGIRACAIQAGEVETPIMQFRPLLPTPEKRALMLRPEDVAAAMVYAASQPPRVDVEQNLIRPTLDDTYPEAQDILARWQRGE